MENLSRNDPSLSSHGSQSKKRPHSSISYQPQNGSNRENSQTNKKPKLNGEESASSFQTATSRIVGVSLPSVLTKRAVSHREVYRENFLRLLDLEFKEDTKEVEERRRKWSRQRLQAQGFSLFDMKGEMRGTTASGETLIKFSQKSFDPPHEALALPYHQFQSGDVVILKTSSDFEVTDMSGLKHTRKSIDAVIVDLDHFSLLVTTSDSPNQLDKLKWRIDKGCNRIAYDRMKLALTTFSTTQKQVPHYNLSGIPAKYHPPSLPFENLKAIILDDSPSAKKKASSPSILQPLHSRQFFPSNFSQWTLNPSQRATILAALSRTLSLIQGPPGTGKTHTVVQLIRLLCHLYKGTGITVLACAYTNVATDNLLEGCLDAGLSALRVGRPVKVRPELRKATLDAKVEDHPHKAHLDDLRKQLQSKFSNPNSLKALREDIQKTEKSIVNDVMSSADVICCTCIYAGDQMLKGTYFPIVIIDECTQATEPAALVPVVAGAAQQLILVGDHHQLPPTIKSKEANDSGLGDSLFSRLIKDANLDVFMLNTQYRMHPKISEFPASHFYGGKLLNGVTESDRPIMPGFDWPFGLPIIFLNIPGTHERRGIHGESHSWMNPIEAFQLCQIVQSLLQTHLVPPRSIGIITPYAAQIRVIYDHLKESLASYTYKGIDLDYDEDEMAGYRGHGIAGITISSVDGFQGREKDIILFSAVRSNTKKKLGFLTDWRRLNVALTRAKRGLVVVGDKVLLSEDPHWKAWIDWVESLGACRTCPITSDAIKNSVALQNSINQQELGDGETEDSPEVASNEI